MHFHAVLQCVSKLHNLFLVKPQPVAEDCSDPRWGKFMVITYFLPLYLLWNVLLGTESSSLPASSGARKARAPSLSSGKRFDPTNGISESQRKAFVGQVEVGRCWEGIVGHGVQQSPSLVKHEKGPSAKSGRHSTLKLDMLKETKVAPHYKSGLLV
ncbi:hypothetical protein ACS0TY_034157 [Phlomoides rotata]